MAEFLLPQAGAWQLGGTYEPVSLPLRVVASMSWMRSRKVYWSAAVALLALLTIWAHTASFTNESRVAGDISDSVVPLRIALWDYYSRHGGPPAHLSKVLPGAGLRNDLWFTTRLSHIRCHLTYAPRATGSKPIAHIACGSPALVGYDIGYDGKVLHRRECGHWWLRMYVQKKGGYPTLTEMGLRL